MRRNIFIFILFTLAMVSCSKEIYLDYRSVDKVTVIEGYVSNEGVSVVITTTRDMSDTTRVPCVNDAEVWLSDSEGWSEELVYADSAYVSPSGAIGIPGVTYTLSVTREGQTFTSQSLMHEAAEISEIGFYYYEILFLKQLLLCAKVQDVVDENNFYHYRLYRENGELYGESVMTDKKNPDSNLNINFMCMDEESTMSDWDMDMVKERLINEGDSLYLEVYTIDETSYNYLYSLGLSGMSSSNPIANFKGGALGYFTTRNIVRAEVVYHADEVQDYELFEQ